MGIYRAGGYSASIKAFVDTGNACLTVAKTNGDRFFLAHPSAVQLPAGTDVDLVIIVDGDIDTTRVTLTNGIAEQQSMVDYGAFVPF